MWQATRNQRPDRAMYRDPAYRAMVIPATCSVPGCQDKATKDHVVEIHQGGNNAPENIQALCLKHNLEKTNAVRKSSRR